MNLAADCDKRARISVIDRSLSSTEIPCAEVDEVWPDEYELVPAVTTVGDR